MQFQLPLTTPKDSAIAASITLPEHNRHGQDESYQENKAHYKSQTEIVLEHLLKGETVTGRAMFVLHDIQDIRPRIAAIKKSGYKLSEAKIKGAKGAKEWKIESKPEESLEG